MSLFLQMVDDLHMPDSEHGTLGLGAAVRFAFGRLMATM